MDVMDHFLGEQSIKVQEHRSLINAHLRQGWEPLQLIGLTFFLTVILVKIWDKIFNREKDLFTTIKESFFKFVRSLPIIGAKIQEELDSTKSEISRNMFPLKKGQKYLTHLPQKGMQADKLIEIVKKDYKGLETTHWENGRCSGAIYASGEENDRMMSEVFSMFVGANLLQPDVFPGPRKMEAEIVAMVCNMFKGGKDACGVVTSCGSESILLACKSYRELAYKRGITKPEILMPESAHAAFVKSGKYFKMKVVKVPLDKKTFRVDFQKMKKMINSNTAMLVGSMPSFPHGACDPIQEIAKLGKKHNIPVHVDQCMGGFLTPFAGKEFKLPPCDFSVDGVTSISADTHKYGKAPKGSSTLLYSHPKYREGQYFTYTDWSGGIYASSTMAGTRSGAIMATCWTALMSNGIDGYKQTADKVLKCRQYIEKNLHGISGIKVFGEPGVNIISFGSDAFDIYRLGDILTSKGWHMYTLQMPAGLNLAITPLFVEGSTRDDFLSDVREGTAKIMKDPSAKSEGMAAIYGMAAKIPDQAIVSEFITGYLDAYYYTK
ncbi:sphingosine-1-phosphate lyase 1-like isoform X2 [Apostichopus japonicus]